MQPKGISGPISNSELIATLYNGSTGSCGFDLLINPRNPKIPWMYGIGTRFDKYKNPRIVVEFEPAQPNTVVGNNVMLFDYDCKDNNAGKSYDELARIGGAIVRSLYMPMSCPYKPHQPLPSYFCDSSSTPDRFNDCARFWFRSQNALPVGTMIGRLILHYSFVMLEPEVSDEVLAPTGQSHGKKGKTGAELSVTTKEPIGEEAQAESVGSLTAENVIQYANVTLQAVNTGMQIIKTIKTYSDVPVRIMPDVHPRMAVFSAPGTKEDFEGTAVDEGWEDGDPVDGVQWVFNAHASSCMQVLAIYDGDWTPAHDYQGLTPTLRVQTPWRVQDPWWFTQYSGALQQGVTISATLIFTATIVISGLGGEPLGLSLLPALADESTGVWSGNAQVPESFITLSPVPDLFPLSPIFTV